MSRFTRAILVLTVVSSCAFGQQWINDWISKTSPAGQVGADTLVSFLNAELRTIIGKKTPEFPFWESRTDSVQTLADYRGSVVVVNFWGLHCSGCRNEMPALSELDSIYSEKGMRVLFLSSDPKDKISSLFASKKFHGVCARLLRVDLQRPYQMLAMPSSFIVDPKGIIRDAWMGPLNFEDWEAKITPYLQASK